MDINQIYKAPAIPKLSRRNISSSVLRSASVTSAVPKLKKTTFSFVKPKISPETLTTDISNIQISESLVETNRILVEIQKQLSYDFAMRIAEEKESIKKIKAAESKRKFAEKEKSLEETKKTGGKLGYVVDKITAPIKNIFERVKEFFSLILTGIVLNAAFRWLQDENNRKLLDGIFYWIGKAFVPAVVGIIGYKVFKWVGRLFKIGKFLYKLPGRIGKLFGIKTPGGSPTLPKIPWWQKNPASLSRSNASYSKFIAGTSNIGDRTRLLKRGMIGPQQMFTKGGPEALTGTAKAAPAVGTATTAAGKLGGKALKAIPFLGSAIAIIEGIARLKDGDIMGAMLSFGTAIPGIGWGFLAADIVRAMMGDAKFDSALGDAFSGQIGLSEEEKKKRMKGSALKNALLTPSIPMGMGFSTGGTIPGKGSGFVDSVKAMLAPGEEVIRTTSAMLFRPLLKDINDNAGRLWIIFTQAIRKLLAVSEYQKDVSQEFSKVIEDFNKYLKDDILKKKTKPGGGGFRVSTTKSNTQSTISSAPKIANINMNISASSGGMTFLPMVLPKQSSAPPQIPQMQGKATEVPTISPINFANYWMEVTPELYGIELYV